MRIGAGDFFQYHFAEIGALELLIMEYWNIGTDGVITETPADVPEHRGKHRMTRILKQRM